MAVHIPTLVRPVRFGRTHDHGELSIMGLIWDLISTKGSQINYSCRFGCVVLSAGVPVTV